MFVDGGAMKNEYDDVNSDWEINDFRMIIIAGTSPDGQPTENLLQNSHANHTLSGINWMENGLLTISLKVSVRFSEREVMSF